mmetsp:Transcript_15009/g.44824  ORF Transcript_15009/g.44824 Transcript_15009/m.44824 type:complete len:162 (-) Transcript_15009:27-512(-)
MRRDALFFLALASGARAFARPRFACARPSLRSSAQHSLRPRRSALYASRDDEGPIVGFFKVARFIFPLGFFLQVVFLITSQQVSGKEALAEYGRLGNQYITTNTDFKNMNRMQIMQIQSDGQQIWWNNVLRDLDNGRPVTPPITTPYPKYELFGGEGRGGE